MPKLDYEIEDFKYNTWKINNWSDLEERATGPEFKAGGWKWRVLLTKRKDDISIFLYFSDQNAPEGWHSCVQFALVLWNPEDPTQYVYHHASSRFSAKKSNRGFGPFDLDKLFTPSGNRTRALIENDSTNITAFVRVLKDPKGNLWLNNDDDSKLTYDVGKTKDSFIFSFKNKNNFKNPILSHVESMDEALIYCNEFGPTFGSDLMLRAKGPDDTEYNFILCEQQSYEKKVREAEDKFLIEDYEVFQVIKA